MSNRTLKAARIYWDSQDPASEGWAYRVTYSDGREESGALEETTVLSDPAEDAEEAVRELVEEYGFGGGEITTGEADGGFAEWEA